MRREVAMSVFAETDEFEMREFNPIGLAGCVADRGRGNHCISGIQKTSDQVITEYRFAHNMERNITTILLAHLAALFETVLNNRK